MLSAVFSGESCFKDFWQIGLRNADSFILDEKHAIVVTDHDLLMRSTVFAGINQNLLQDERHPLLVGQKLFMRHRHVKRQVFVDEKRHVFAQNLLH